jgi:hypothetical protein
MSFASKKDMSIKALKDIKVFLSALQFLITKFQIGVEYEQHCGGVVQSGVLGHRSPGFKTTPANKLSELNAGLDFYYQFQISLNLVMFDVIQLTLRTAH